MYFLEFFSKEEMVKWVQSKLSVLPIPPFFYRLPTGASYYSSLQGAAFQGFNGLQCGRWGDPGKFSSTDRSQSTFKLLLKAELIWEVASWTCTLQQRLLWGRKNCGLWHTENGKLLLRERFSQGARCCSATLLGFPEKSLASSRTVHWFCCQARNRWPLNC